MGKAEATFAWSNEDEPSMRQWFGDFLTLLDDAGFVRTTDTGQVDPETATHTGTTQGTVFATYRFDDALQATHPVFFKIEMNTGSSGGTPLHLTVGKGTDGAGGITGVLRDRVGLGGNAASQWSTSTPYTHLAASGDGWAGFLGAVDVDSVTAVGALRALVKYFVIERSRDAAGNLTGDGLMVLTATPNVLSTGSGPSLTNVSFEPSLMAINYTSGTHVEQAVPVIAPYSINGTVLGPSTSLAAGSIGPAFPWDLIAPGVPPWRSCVMVSIPAGDMPSGVFTTNLCGQNGDFRAVPPSDTHNRWGVAFTASTGTPSYSRWFGVGMRWED